MRLRLVASTERCADVTVLAPPLELTENREALRRAGRYPGPYTRPAQR